MATTAPTFQSEKEKITVTNKSKDSMAKKLKIEGIDEKLSKQIEQMESFICQAI